MSVKPKLKKFFDRIIPIKMKYLVSEFFRASKGINPVVSKWDNFPSGHFAFFPLVKL